MSDTIRELHELLGRMPAGEARVHLAGGVVPPTVEIGEYPIIDACSVLCADLVAAALNALPALLAAARAAMEYRAAQERCDLTGEWEQAREAAVVLDAAVAALGEE